MYRDPSDRTEHRCAGKIGHRTEAAALRHIEDVHRIQGSAKYPERAYLCDGRDGVFPCFQWHTTSVPAGTTTVNINMGTPKPSLFGKLKGK